MARGTTRVPLLPLAISYSAEKTITVHVRSRDTMTNEWIVNARHAIARFSAVMSSRKGNRAAPKLLLKVVATGDDDVRPYWFTQNSKKAGRGRGGGDIKTGRKTKHRKERTNTHTRTHTGPPETAAFLTRTPSHYNSSTSDNSRLSFPPFYIFAGRCAENLAVP